MKTEIKLLSDQDINDFVELIDVFAEVFEINNFIKPDIDYLQNILTKPGFLILVAKTNHKVVGGLTVYKISQYYSKKSLAYVYDLAVLKQFQRQGIGKALMKQLTDYCKGNDFEEVFVQASRTDKHALNFYRSIKPTNEEDVIHFNYSFFKKENIDNKQ
ncbi:MAG: GNAT family N-acetyltransferase [Bacteroidota bacterium]|nr:GNAT family N-acetyltransferase [Bacteroidota bacterium]